MLRKIKDKLIQLVYTGDKTQAGFLSIIISAQTTFLSPTYPTVPPKIGPLYTQEQLQSVSKYLKPMNKQ